VTNQGKLVGESRSTLIDSRGPAETILETFKVIINRHLFELAGQSVLGVGMGFPGPFDYEAGVSRIQGVAKYESILGVNVGAEIRNRLKMPDLVIRFRNDAEAAIVGEGLYGVGKPFARIIGMTLGTGCGSAFLVNGRSVTTGQGVPDNGWLYPIPFQGRQADDVFSIRGLLAAFSRAGITVENVKTGAELARQGDMKAREVFKQFGQDLADFLTPWAHSFQADAVLIQGGIANAFDFFGDSLSSQLSVPIRQGTLKTEAALLGAAALFFHT
jgi:glucokinase